MNSAHLSRCPYRGLVPFHQADAARFFGRDAEIRIVSANLLGARLTLLYGDSGVGKSSLLRAGVLPHLQRQAEATLPRLGRARFRVVLVDRWQGDPLAAVRTGLIETLGRAPGDPADLGYEPGRFVEYLAGWTDRVGAPILFVFDQFEEYLRYHEREHGEGTFAEEFPRAVTRPDLKVNFLLAVREDEYARLDRFKPALPGLYRNYLRLRYLGRAAAREACERPLEVGPPETEGAPAPRSIEPALVDAILEDVKVGRVVLGDGGIGAAGPAEEEVRIQTPYLQLVLTRVWEAEVNAGSTVLRLATYRSLGGADRIVRSHLDGALAGLAPDEQALAAGVFRHLVTPSGAKVAHTLADLADYTRTDAVCLQPALDRLCGNLRILRPVAPVATTAGAPRFEIYTDSLARPVLDWGNRFRRAQERVEAEQKLAEERRRKLVFRRLSAGLAVALVLAITLGTLAWLKQREATLGGLIREARVRLELNPTEALGLAVQAAGMTGWQPARSRLAAEQMLRAALLDSNERRATGAPPAGLVRTAVGEWHSPDGRLRFRRGADPTLALGVLEMQRTSLGAPANAPWDLLDTQLRTEVLAVEFNPDGSRFAVCGAGAVTVWALTEAGPRLVCRLPDLPTTVWAAAFSPDPGQALLATVGDDATNRLWNPHTGALLAAFGGHASGLKAVAISPDGRFLASGGDDRTATVWDVGNQQRVAILRGALREVTRLRFSDDGQFVWTGDGAGRVRCWASRVGVRVAAAPPGESLVHATPTPGGIRFVSTSSTAATVWTWDSSGAAPARPLTQVDFEVAEARFSADGYWVALAGTGPQIAIRSLTTPPAPPVLLATSNAVTGLGFSPDTEWLATLEPQGQALVWRWRERTHGPSLSVAKAQDGDVRFGLAGDRLIVAAGNEPRVFALEGRAPSGAWSGKRVAEFTGRHPGIVTHLALSANGTQVLSVGEGGTAWVWQLADARPVAGPLKLRGEPGLLLAGGFSPDGRFLVTGGEAGVAQVWDPRQEDPWLLELPGHRERAGGQGDVCAVWFSADGRQAYTAGWEGTIRRHDTRELQPLPGLLRLAEERLQNGP